MKYLKNLKPNEVKKISDTLMIIVVALAALATLIESLFLAITGLVFILILLVFNSVFYRCPHCHKHLGRDKGDFCPHCGEKL